MATANNKNGKAETVVQIDDKYLSPAEVTDYVVAQRATLLPQDRARMVVSIRADRDVKMSLINDVRQALRRARVSNVLMSAEGESISGK